MEDLITKIRKADYVYIIGNGGSASTANHFANDLVKVSHVRAVSLCANEAVLTAFANDCGYENVFVEQLRVFLKKGDLLITISGSGKSINIVKAVNYAREIKADLWSFPTMNEYKCSMQEIENKHLIMAHKIVAMLPQKQKRR